MNTRNSTTPDPQAEHLDNEIASIRTEIQNLKRRKRFLSSSLLSSKKVQSLLQKPLTSLQTELSPLAEAADSHSQTNHYRIAFGTTAFPFKDPSPSAKENQNLLGVRIDVSTRNGRFAKPYYVLLRRERVNQKEKVLRVHRHTIPGFISVAKLEGFYLPGKIEVGGRDSEDSAEEEGEGEEEPLKQKQKQSKVSRRQDLRGFVRELRRELTAWHLRCDAVDLLRERLGLAEGEGASVDRLSPESKAGIVSLAATASETRYVRLEWEDGRVGRFKLTNAGVVERAVVIGDFGRDKQVEDAMVSGGGRIESLLERLKEHMHVSTPSS